MRTRKPGHHSRLRLRHLLVVVVTGVGATLALAVAGFWWWPFSLMGVPLLWVLWRETDPGGVLDPAPHRKGARGEETVGEILQALDRRFSIHHGIDTGRGNVDHVVIGPTGVFVIETKNVAGRFELRKGHVTHNGYDGQAILRQAVAEAMAIKDRLREAGVDAWVEAVVASTEAEVQNDRLQARNVTVLAAKALPEFILSRRIRLSSTEIDRAETAISRGR